MIFKKPWEKSESVGLKKSWKEIRQKKKRVDRKLLTLKFKPNSKFEESKARLDLSMIRGYVKTYIWWADINEEEAGLIAKKLISIINISDLEEMQILIDQQLEKAQ